MCVRSLVILIIALTCVCPAMAGADWGRESFDFDWRFSPRDSPGADNADFDDSAWAIVDLPHDFAIDGLFDPAVANGKWNGFRPLRIGWYRKSFKTPPGGTARLEFEGVFSIADVWVNGVPVAHNTNGYLGFGCDITQHLKSPGQLNTVAVRADSSMSPAVTWYSGGGIYRHVWLITSGQVRVARHGTFVTTLRISHSDASVHIRTEVENCSANDQAVTLTSDVIDPAGHMVGSVTATAHVKRASTYVFEQDVVIPHPQLWDLDHPVMHRVLSSVAIGGNVRDRQQTPFGIREIRMTSDGLFLNGRRRLVQGFNIHGDLGCLGVAAFDRAIERRLAVMKEIGCNAVRLAHNPHAPALLDLCDRMGILVFDEAFCNWGDPKDGPFARTWQRDLEEFLRRDRNHPSVFIWSVGNEVSAAERGPDYGCAQYDAMVAVVHRMDPTRPATSALRPIRKDGKGGAAAKFGPDNDADIHPMALRMDVMSANYMEPWFAKDRLKYPSLIYIASECTTGDSGYSPWRNLDRDHAVGLFYWGGINYIGESRGWPLKCWNSGFIDWCGFRRPSSWVLQSLLSEQPMVKLIVNRPETTFVHTDGVRITLSGLLMHWNFPAASRQEIEIVSNAQEVELQLNGRSLGVRKRNGQQGLSARHYWTVAWQPGTLTAIARNNGLEVARDELKTAKEARRLRLSPDRAQLRADGQDLSHITVEVVDDQGVVVPDAHPMITFEVSGLGRNAGVQNSDVLSDEPFQANQRSAFQGRALLVVRASRQPGQIKVNAAAENLEPATLILPVRPDR